MERGKEEEGKGNRAVKRYDNGGRGRGRSVCQSTERASEGRRERTNRLLSILPPSLTLQIHRTPFRKHATKKSGMAFSPFSSTLPQTYSLTYNIIFRPLPKSPSAPSLVGLPLSVRKSVARDEKLFPRGLIAKATRFSSTALGVLQSSLCG